MKYTTVGNVFFITLLLVPVFLYCLSVEISYGELIDKITILTIKLTHITDPIKLNNITTELDSLQKTYHELIGINPEIIQLQNKLLLINQELWNIEDAIRIKEHKGEFDEEFITLARNVYITNDKRAALKKQIDILLNSRITEEKSYQEYSS